jgi:protein-tyrosine phosphatase
MTTDSETPLELITRYRVQHQDASVQVFHAYEPADVFGDGSVWIGSMFDAVNMEWLREQGITHVVNCADAVASYAKRVTGNTVIREVLVLEAEDSAEYMILDRHLDDVLRFCDAAFRGDCRAKILVHCMAGVNRSATLALAYAACSSQRGCEGSRIQRLADAFVRVMRKRPIILTNVEFYNQLLIWAEM